MTWCKAATPDLNDICSAKIETYSEKQEQKHAMQTRSPIFNPLKTNEGAANCRTSKRDETHFEQLSMPRGK
jgi:hypothetical protein